MIISITLILLLYVVTMMLATVKNPVKMSMMLLFFSSLIFLKFYLTSGMVWFPILFFLIFMGGILMMFMILSSVMPNELNKKSKKYMFTLPFFLLILSLEIKSEYNSNFSKMVKTFIDSDLNFMIMLALMMSYFFISVLMVSKEETPMRKSLC